MASLPQAFLEAYPDGTCAGVELHYAVEDEPLDTAGAIRFAAGEANVDERFVVVNGDVLKAMVPHLLEQGVELLMPWSFANNGGSNANAVDLPDDLLARLGGEEFVAVLVDTAGIRRRGAIEPGIEKFSVLRAVRAELGRVGLLVLFREVLDGLGLDPRAPALRLPTTRSPTRTPRPPLRTGRGRLSSPCRPPTWARCWRGTPGCSSPR